MGAAAQHGGRHNVCPLVDGGDSKRGNYDNGLGRRATDRLLYMCCLSSRRPGESAVSAPKASAASSWTPREAPERAATAEERGGGGDRWPMLQVGSALAARAAMVPSEGPRAEAMPVERPICAERESQDTTAPPPHAITVEPAVSPAAPETPEAAPPELESAWAE